MTPKTRGGNVKRFVSKPSKNNKRKAEEVSKGYSKKKKVVVEDPKSNSNSHTMTEIDNYEDNSESSQERTDSVDEESSTNNGDT